MVLSDEKADVHEMGFAPFVTKLVGLQHHDDGDKTPNESSPLRRARNGDSIATGICRIN